MSDLQSIHAFLLAKNYYKRPAEPTKDDIQLARFKRHAFTGRPRRPASKAVEVRRFTAGTGVQYVQFDNGGIRRLDTLAPTPALT